MRTLMKQAKFTAWRLAAAPPVSDNLYQDGSGEQVMAEKLRTYNKEEIEERLVQYPGWSFEEDGQLHAEFKFKNFVQTILFVNAIAHLAEQADHHPDLLIYSYNQLAIRLMTHSEKGITDRDFDLVRQIHALPH